MPKYIAVLLYSIIFLLFTSSHICSQDKITGKKIQFLAGLQAQSTTMNFFNFKNIPYYNNVPYKREKNIQALGLKVGLHSIKSALLLIFTLSPFLGMIISIVTLYHLSLWKM
jgi:hypothetical protein